MSPNEKLIAARCRLLTNEPWMGHMAMLIEWRESDFHWTPNKTMGVLPKKNGIICFWCTQFIEERSLEEIYGAVQHEIEHVVRLHLSRPVGRDYPRLRNVALDMCVNGKKSNPQIGYKSGGDVVLPVPKDSMVWVPEDWPNGETAEYCFDRIIKDAKVITVNGFDDHSLWDQHNISNDCIRQTVHSMAQRALSQAAGNVPGHLIGVLDALAKPIVNWQQLLRSYMSRNLGKRRYTFSRRSRRQDRFGTKGVSLRGAARCSIIVDTSGSITHDMLQQFFGEIEEIAVNAKVNLLQWDCEFQDFNDSYRRGDWKKIEIKGRGGTDMGGPLRYLYERGLVGDVCVCLTDGYCGYSEPMPFPLITCITTDDGREPSWGHVVRMKQGSGAKAA